MSSATWSLMCTAATMPTWTSSVAQRSKTTRRGWWSIVWRGLEMHNYRSDMIKIDCICCSMLFKCFWLGGRVVNGRKVEQKHVCS